MILYNLQHAWRSLAKNRLLTFIVLTSFSVGLAACMVLALYIHHEYTVDQCYPGHERIYRLIDTSENKATMDHELAQRLKDGFPEIEGAALVNRWEMKGLYVQSIPENQFVSVDAMMSTNNAFFSVFSIKTIEGNAAAPFVDENSLVLTRTLALKLYGRTEVIGEQVSLSGLYSGVISAVVEDLPKNTSLGAEVFANCMGEKGIRFGMACNQGGCYSPMSIYIKLTNNVGASSCQNNINTHFPDNNSTTKVVELQALKDIYLSKGITQNFNKAGSTTMMSIYLAIAIVILFLSVFNYINFTLSRQLTMLRQLGIRLTNGAGLAQVRVLLITEVLITLGLAFTLAVVITALALPTASNLLDTSLHIRDLLLPSLFLLIIGVLLALIIVTALAPLYILSTFNIESLFGKKNIRLGKQRIKWMLTIVQLSVNIILLAALLTIGRQLNYVKSANLGFDVEHLIRLHSIGPIYNMNVLKQQVNQCAFVQSSSASQGALGNIMMQIGNGWKEDNVSEIVFQFLHVDKDFLSTMRIPLMMGRELSMADEGKSCYINEEALRQIGWKSIEGKRFESMGGFDIVGVTADFKAGSLHNIQRPVCLAYLAQKAPEEKGNAFNTLSVRLRPGNVLDQMKELERIWKATLPELPFRYTFYDDLFDSFYRKEQRQAEAIAIFSVIALLITCMGLLGQAYQASLARVKEIGIRKINGAGLSTIMLLLNRDLIKWAAIAFVLAVPVAYYAMEQWLQNFAYKVGLSWWIFALAGLATLLLAAITVSAISWKAANTNPAKTLKSE